MRTLILYAASLIAGIAMRASDVVVDVTQIAGRTRSEVAAVLGAPKSVTNIKQGEQVLYAKGDTEVVFVSGKAEWITVNGLANVRFDAGALAALGIKSPVPPAFSNRNVIRWTDVAGIREISVFPGKGERCDYGFVVVTTPPKGP